MNGLLSSRHDAPYPPSPEELEDAGKGDKNHECVSDDITHGGSLLNGVNDILPEPSCQSDDLEPLLSNVGSNRAGISKLSKGFNWHINRTNKRKF